ncbi:MULTISPECIES: glycosyltransferase family 4 protein [unclassified Pseudomonas]|uniref:glycosyltransferase family 4 protein n=1 Tax=unclassified Pseudomonas TaxID=196821 RepID=UPI0021C6FA45|nr:MULTISPECIES: glycosyltransferase family 4 protein [unclassified Pseudomonas]MCU1734966.1 glycosyltransferase family 4 protein [Pseudomonas sp. 20P_3.2_Bac4]MCU1743441.1 glycosyltransferase family 4 protein [Pseudomonas sp. 20P_3.2_Bac5]
MDAATAVALGAQLNAPAPRQPIIHLLNSGGFYGAERMLLDHCLATPGQHRVLFLDAPAELLARFRAAGVDCQCRAGLVQPLLYLREQHGQRPLLNAHNFKGLLLGWLAACLWRLPLVATQHGFTPRNLKQRFYTWLTLQLCRTAVVSQVVCVAESIARILRRTGVAAQKIRVIPNGLPEASGQTPRVARAGEWLAGYVGRLSSEKGPDLFLDTLIPLCRRYPHVNAVMLGDGPERAALQARINAAGLLERIRLPGFQHDMRPWMSRLDALVISSRTEGTPMILLEAMQDGVPVVAFGVGGIPDVIEHGRSGLLAAPLAVDELAAQLSALIDDPAQASELTAQARHTQRERYHLPTLAQRWAQVYLGAATEVRA